LKKKMLGFTKKKKKRVRGGPAEDKKARRTKTGKRPLQKAADEKKGGRQEKEGKGRKICGERRVQA